MVSRERSKVEVDLVTVYVDWYHTTKQKGLFHFIAKLPSTAQPTFPSIACAIQVQLDGDGVPKPLEIMHNSTKKQVTLKM